MAHYERRGHGPRIQISPGPVKNPARAKPTPKTSLPVQLSLAFGGQR